MKFKCQNCELEHDLSEITFGANCPIQWNMISEKERENSILAEEQCIIEIEDKKHYFIRACLEIPIKENNQSFIWGVWCSINENAFNQMIEYWDNPKRTELNPYFAWLCTQIPTYEDTVFLKTYVHLSIIGERPIVKLEKS